MDNGATSLFRVNFLRNAPLKTSIAAATFLILSSIAGLTQQPVATSMPETVQSQLAILSGAYPKIDAKKFPKAPADSAWILRAPTSIVGTVEVGFQGTDVVYMIFRRGASGFGWTNSEIETLHLAYYANFLKETYNPFTRFFSRYEHSAETRINAGLIRRRDFDPRILSSGL